MKIKLFCVLLILGSPTVFVSNIVAFDQERVGLLASEERKVELTAFQDYEWIWDEFARTGTGDNFGDDSIFWGSSLGPYYNSTEADNKLKLATISFPELVNYFELGQSYLGKSITGVRLGLAPENSNLVKYDTVIIGTHHGREAITVLDTLAFMDYLIYSYQQGLEWASNLLTESYIYLIPVLNPDALDYLHIFPWARKNLQPFDGDGDGNLDDFNEILDADGDNYLLLYEDSQGNDYFEGVDGNDIDEVFGNDFPGGVDLNRNYDYEFIGEGSSSESNSFVYRGPEPFSAPETEAYKNFATSNHFFTSVSLHSGIDAIITPWGYSDEPVVDESIFQTIIYNLQNISNFPTWEETGGYAVNGEWGDWMYGSLNSLSVTIETYGDLDALHYRADSTGNTGIAGIWDRFNPPSEIAINRSLDKITPMLVYLANFGGSNETIREIFIDKFEIESNQATIINITGSSITAGNSISVQKQNIDYSWDTVKTRIIDTTGNFQIFIDLGEIETDKEYRISIGKNSRRYSYYLELSENVEYAVVMNQKQIPSLIKLIKSSNGFLNLFIYEIGLIILTISITLLKIKQKRKKNCS